MESVHFSPSSCNLSIPSPITPPLSALISPDGTDQVHLPSIADIPPHLLIIFKGSQTFLLMEKFRFYLKEGAGMLVHYNAIYLLHCGRASPQEEEHIIIYKGQTEHFPTDSHVISISGGVSTYCRRIQSSYL